MADPLLRRSAIISNDGRHRYELRRTWDETLPPYVAGYLNPSVADHEIDDPTAVRTHRRAASLGCGEAIVWNLGAGRATDPGDWLKMKDPIGPENDDHIRRILIECRQRNGIAVVGWGALGGTRGRDRVVIRIASEVGISFKCLGVTKFGQPRHPLYIANAQSLVDWPVTR